MRRIFYWVAPFSLLAGCSSLEIIEPIPSVSETPSKIPESVKRNKKL